jgi:hypothetical protein
MQLREGVPAERRKKNQELVGGGEVEGVHPDWLEKRKRMQIDWRRRGLSHGIGEQAWQDRSSAPPPRIPGAAGPPPSLSLSCSESAPLRCVAPGGVGAHSCCPFPRAQLSPAAPLFPARALKIACAASAKRKTDAKSA